MKEVPVDNYIEVITEVPVDVVTYVERPIEIPVIREVPKIEYRNIDKIIEVEVP